MTTLLYILNKINILLDVEHAEKIPNFTTPRQLRTPEENVRDKELNYATHAPDNGLPEAEGEQLKHDDAGVGHECESFLKTILHWSRQQNANS